MTDEPAAPTPTRRPSAGSRDGTGSGPGASGRRGARSRPRAEERPTLGSRTWLEGSRTARRWNVELLGWVAIGLGVGTIGSILVGRAVVGLAGVVLADVVLWAGMLAPVVVAFTRGVPRGLLRIRALDLLWAAGFGLALRAVQGGLAVAAGDSGALPTFPMINGALPDGWLFLSVISPIVVAPVIESLLFHGVIVVAVYRIARRGLEGALLAIVCSTAAFVAVHAITVGIADWGQTAALALVGATCAGLVVLTGRVWTAVGVHAVYNAAGVALALAGTALG
ncbi:CPBP family intramembrane glutamic endopeptidase [Microbacterium sp. ZXX196]|uniref:CPBP family intramembrane glutamic endopeptidase n=1 Tax=Microbacterium sp. ZXX196 TaxID=2609291 RepID=UPI0018AD0540